MESRTGMQQAIQDRGPRIAPSTPLALSRPGEVRIGPVLAIPALLREFGVDLGRACSSAGVEPRLFRDPESRIAFDALGRLLESCVMLTGCGHFGLLVGERFRLSAFGPLGPLLRNAATVGEALHDLIQHLYIQDRAAAPLLLHQNPSRVVLGYFIHAHDTPGLVHLYAGTIAICHRILRELCGPAWHPIQAQFSYRRPDATAPYRRLFGPCVSFDAEVSGIVFASCWLARPVAGADPALHASAARRIRQLADGGAADFAERVQRVLPQLVLSDAASAESVAQIFGVHVRTLRRRLEMQGMHLQQLVSQTRFELARHLLENTRLPVSTIAAALHYADLACFSRAFRNWALLSPKQWRVAAWGPEPMS